MQKVGKFQSERLLYERRELGNKINHLDQGCQSHPSSQPRSRCGNSRASKRRVSDGDAGLNSAIACPPLLTGISTALCSPGFGSRPTPPPGSCIPCTGKTAWHHGADLAYGLYV